MKNVYQAAYDKGFLPGPFEREKEFFERVKATQRVLLHPKKYINEKGYEGAILSPLGGAALLSNTKNKFYHAASTTIVELKDGLILPIISVPSSRWIKKGEVLKHELVHARRALFEEKKFEEAIAFRTSTSKFRALVSPSFGTNRDLLLFMVAASLTSFSILPIITCVTFFSIRGIRCQRAMNKCLFYLQKKTNHQEEVLAAMTDSEIISMAKGELEKINFSLFRWKFLETIFGKIK
ncbi:MAG: hypothetical protein SP4CHLAM5_04150 [Chlamydiia bacterium]|nr:hypothetical protein [Chlamydiia bacterium]MCH9618288.1 hypothetical protein [Chlamydiia bacterium]MCH9624161.1 hypothetical protein [Chlamydiia bacterium]